MTQVQHQKLWTSWQKERSEAVFSALVKANIDLVYTTALRSMGGDEHLAKDVTQSVFIDLVRKSPDMPQDVSLTGWLYRHTRYTASKTVRTEQRRRTREKSYHIMESHPQSNGEDTWESIAPHLDHCLQKLSEQDRETILLRYFNKHSLKDVGAELGISADAAQKRVSRALEKLRLALGRQGISLPAATLASAFSMSAVVAAPAGLVAQVTSVAVTALGSGSGLGFLFTTLKSNIIAMKTQYVITGTAIAVVGAPLVYQQMTLNSLREDLRQQRAEITSLDSTPSAYNDWQQTQQEIKEFERLRKDQEELKRLEEKVAQLKANDADNKATLLRQLAMEQSNLDQAQKEKEKVIERVEFQAHQVRVINVMKHMGLAAAIFRSENDDELPESIDQLEIDSDGLSKQLEEVPLAGFEFMPHERKLVRFEPNKILFREIESRFDGETYYKAYTFCDGSVQIGKSDNNDFSEFESKYTATLENMPTSEE